MADGEFSRSNLDKRAVFHALDYKPTNIQLAIHESDAKYRFVACGVRFGKTFLASHEGMAELFIPGTRGWIVAPTYNLADKAFRTMFWKAHTHAPKGFIRAKSERDRYLKTNINSEVEAKSAENKDSLIGESLDWAIIDEAARIDEEAYEMVRARLVDRDGWMLAISTPTGRNWFEKGYRRGQDPAQVDWRSWSAPTSANPWIKPEVLAEIKSTTIERTWRQEYLAEFLDDDGTVFKNVDACATVTAQLPAGIPQRPYVVGWDVGKYQDYSVLSAWDSRARSVVALQRFQGDWPIQKKRARDFCIAFNGAHLVMDATGEGDAVWSDMLEWNRRDPFSRKIDGVRMHAPQVKRDLIESLALGLEQMGLSYPKDPKLLDELRSYEFERKEKSGQISYHAPSRAHDDFVMSLALGWSAVSKSRGTGNFVMG